MLNVGTKAQPAPLQVRSTRTLHTMLEDLDPNRDYLPGREAQGSSWAEYVVGRQSPEKEDDRFGNRVGNILYKNNNLKINQRLKVISMCLPLLFSFSAPLVDWPDINLKLLTAIWVWAYKNAWNLVRSTATCLFTS